MPYYLKHTETEFSDFMPYAKAEPPARDKGEWVEGIPSASMKFYRPKTTEQTIQELYETLPVDLQEKFEDEIIKGAFYLERGNLKMVSKKLGNASKKVNKDNPLEVKLFEDISKLLLG